MNSSCSTSCPRSHARTPSRGRREPRRGFGPGREDVPHGSAPIRKGKKRTSPAMTKCCHGRTIHSGCRSRSGMRVRKMSISTTTTSTACPRLSPITQPKLFRDVSVQMEENSQDWRGLFMASAFFVVAGSLRNRSDANILHFRCAHLFDLGAQCDRARPVRASRRREVEVMTAHAQAADLLADRAGAGDTLLDVGCGSGYFFPCPRQPRPRCRLLGRRCLGHTC